MWIVKIALQRSYTFIVLAIIIVLLGGYAIAKTATDIFPNIKIPVAAVIWRYTGLLPEEMADRIGIINGGKLIAVGTREELRIRSGSSGQLEETYLSLTAEGK